MLRENKMKRFTPDPNRFNLFSVSRGAPGASGTSVVILQIHVSLIKQITSAVSAAQGFFGRTGPVVPADQNLLFPIIKIGEQMRRKVFFCIVLALPASAWCSNFANPHLAEQQMKRLRQPLTSQDHFS
jgi:hypothetical protein